MAASKSRVLISQFRKLGTSIPTCRSSSTSIYTHGSSQDPTSIPTSRSSYIPIRTHFTFYPAGEQKCVERLSKVAPVEICYKGGWTPDRVDKLIAGSPQAVCCFYPYFAEADKQHTPAFIQMLLKRFPDVKPFHFFLYDHSFADEFDHFEDEAVVALNILSLPTFYFYKNGEKVGEVVGNSILRFKKVLEELYNQGSSNMDSVKCSETSTAHTSISSEQMLTLQDAPSSEHVQTNGCSAQVSKMSTEFKTPKVLAYQETKYSAEESSGPTSPVSSFVVEKHEEKPSSQIGELVDFRGLGKISITYVPLLEEVCAWHPSLIESQRKRSRMFAECAFTALGRLLHFLNTTWLKDMMKDTCQHDSCEHLQVLWDEVETFKFDLTWLEPFVQSALAMMKFGQKERLLKKLRDDVDTLETEIKRLRNRLAVAEVEHELARTDLGKAEESFGEAAMNSKLGCGRH